MVSPVSPDTMSDPQNKFKNPMVAAGLAYLIPGAGHFYQGRLFKGVLYSACILGTFFYGMHLGDWRTVYSHTYHGGHQGMGDRSRKWSFGYFAQLGVGLPALLAIVQTKRYGNVDENYPQRTLDAPLSAPFTGTMYRETDDGEVKQSITGEITLEPFKQESQREVRGNLKGATDDGQPIELSLTGPFFLGQPIAASPHRQLNCGIEEQGEAQAFDRSGRLEGSIPRRLADWIEVPLDDNNLRELHGRLGKYYELALVYTWIAGLLNVLAVWDALEGPAYGHGDEEQPSDEEPNSKDKSDGDESETQTADSKKSTSKAPAAQPVS